MTNNEAGTPLWTKERINEMVLEILATMPITAKGLGLKVGHVISSEYEFHRLMAETQLDNLRERNAELEAARAADAQTIATLRAQVAEALEQNEQLSKMVSMEFEQSMNKGQHRTQPGGEGDNA